MPQAHNAAEFHEKMIKLRDRAFFEKLADLGITASDELDANASKKLSEDLAQICKAKGLETAEQLYHFARCVIEEHEQEYGVDEIALKQLVEKLTAELGHVK